MGKLAERLFQFQEQHIAKKEIFNKQNRLLPLDSSFKTGFAIFPDEVLIIRKKRETFSSLNQLCVSVSQAQRVVDDLFFAFFASFHGRRSTAGDCSNSFLLRISENQHALRSLGEAGW